MIRLFLLITIFFGAISASAATKVDVEYAEKTELVGIVSHLADIPGHNFTEEVLADYLAEVDSVFAAYRTHEAVKFAREQLMVVRYLMSHPIDMHGYTLEDWIKMDEVDKRFVMIRDVIRVLDEREKQLDKYPTMRSFMPRYVETVKNFVAAAKTIS